MLLSVQELQGVLLSVQELQGVLLVSGMRSGIQEEGAGAGNQRGGFCT